MTNKFIVASVIFFAEDFFWISWNQKDNWELKFEFFAI